MAALATGVKPIEAIRETSDAGRVVADVNAISTLAADTERVRDSVPLWLTRSRWRRGLLPGIALTIASVLRCSAHIVCRPQRDRHWHLRRFLQLRHEGPRRAARFVTIDR